MTSPFYWKTAPVRLDGARQNEETNMPTLEYPALRLPGFRLRTLVNVNFTIDGPYDEQGNDRRGDWTIQWIGDGNAATVQPGPGTRISLLPRASAQQGTYQLRVVTYLGGLEMQDLRVNLVVRPAVENTMLPAPMGPDDGPKDDGTGGGVGPGRLPGVETVMSNYCASGTYGY